MAFRPCKQAACGYRAFPQKIRIMDYGENDIAHS